jgi:hypothetical protein
MAELQLEKMTALGESTIFGVQESRGTKAKRGVVTIRTKWFRIRGGDK